MLDPVVVTSLQITAKFCKNRYKSFSFYPYIAPSTKRTVVHDLFK